VNKDTFLRLVKNPHHIPDEELEKLEDVTKIFPYCSLAYLLIAQGHFEHASMLASQKLRLAAAYALDRETLKLLLLSEDHLEKTSPENSSQSLTQPSEYQVITLAEENPDDLETLMSESSRVYTTDQLLDSNTIQPEDRFKVLDSADEETPPLQLGHLNEDEAVVERFSKRLKRSVQRDIIDSFIKSEPRIPTLNRAEKDSFTDRDLSEKSIKPPEIISENLANILIKQGKIDKAIDIYEKLILKFPEKKAYFASRIEDMKNL